MPLQRIIVAILAMAPLAVCADSISISLNGLNSELKENARVFLSLASLEDRSDLSEAAIRRIHRRAPGQIERSLQPFGHYNPRISRKLVRESPGNWLATYTVDPGPPVLPRQVRVDVLGPGSDEAALTAVLAENALQPGAQLRHDLYKNLKTSLRRVSLNRGYFDARFTTHTLQVDPAENTADIALVLETGPRYSFGRVSIEQDVISDSLVKRYISIEEGQPFDQTGLLDVQYALQDSGFYSSVEVTAEREQADNLRVPVTIRTVARKRQRYSVGIGYGTDVGARASIGWENRRINKRGHQANIDLRVSQTRIDFSTRYSVPIGDPRSERFVWSLAHRDEDLGDDTQSRRQELAATQTNVLGEWQRNLYLQLTRETSQIGEVITTDTLLLPGISFSRSQGDRAVQPRRASRLSADLRGSHETLGSDTNFVRLKLETRLVRPVGRGRVLLRGDIGTSVVGEFSRLPASQRYFAGGDRSVRGYGLNELGPRDADGRNIGGRHFAAGSIELEWPIAGRWSTAFFVDAGNAFDSFGDELEYSVGVGGRMRTPVGVIRLDVAKPVSEGGKSLRLHIGIGPDL